MRALIIEDDVAIVRNLKLILESEGFIVDTAHNGEEGFDIAKFYEYDVILLDLLLPDVKGYELLKRMRASRIVTPVIILSGLKEKDSIVQGIDEGADDYLVKPFNKEELLARIRAVVRRSKGHAESEICVGDLTVNLRAQQAAIYGKPISLTAKEYAILQLLVLRKGATLSKEMFLNHLYGGIDEPELKIIDVFVCKLRKKISDALGRDENYIQTVWGRGYVLREDVSEESQIPSELAAKAKKLQVISAAQSSGSVPASQENIPNAEDESNASEEDFKQAAPARARG